MLSTPRPAVKRFRRTHTKNQPLALAVRQALEAERPMTLRQLFYRMVSAGLLPSTAKAHYNRLARLTAKMRERGDLPMNWMVDHLRSTMKPSSWSGLPSFGDQMRRLYRRDFWAGQPDYIEFLIEKDATASSIYPVTYEFDVALRVCRGHGSISFAADIAEHWRKIQKPITAYYLGDFDPSGFEIEERFRDKLFRYSGGREFQWHRIGVNKTDFEDFDLLPLAIKETDKLGPRFRATHGSDCAELDAIPPAELRRRVRSAIESHIDRAAWERLRELERVEKESISEIVARINQA